MNSVAIIHSISHSSLFIHKKYKHHGYYFINAFLVWFISVHLLKKKTIILTEISAHLIELRISFQKSKSMKSKHVLQFKNTNSQLCFGSVE